ncbi:helix-turn-helix domain-containing protein [Mechercharimyces sp. CAU 1602]|uniref:helix-turn-helix domain-containing protein n=1 Tax=Mechercharimyces sp. CAU 1602 TaxID=2973933 RepID=UPI0037CCC18B
MAKLGLRTNREIATLTGMSERAIGILMRPTYFEEDKRIYFGTIEKLCNTFNIQVTDIFEYVPDDES